MALEHEYPLSPLELFATVTDLDYLVARHARFGGVGDPEVTTQDGQVVVSITRQLPTDKIPGPVRSMVGDGIIVQIDTWNQPGETADLVTATWRADVGNAPAQLGGAHTIEAVAAGAKYLISVDVTIRVPLVGRQLASQVAGYLNQLIAKEQEYLAEWIAENR
ncbi:MAG TPA: DUF2505 domain-containing protein [Actinomycetes bacterium]|nr:DUF2505 domain-containing protein [Actinomycetes bacterium]